MCKLLVGSPKVIMLGMEDHPDRPIAVHVERAGDRPDCPGCVSRPEVKGRKAVVTQGYEPCW